MRKIKLGMAMKFKHIVLESFILVTAGLFFSQSAFGDSVKKVKSYDEGTEGCSNLGNNEPFVRGMDNLHNLLEAGKMDEVIEQAKPLFRICKGSPALLYYTGVAFREKGDVERAKKYFLTAAENIKNFSVDDSITRKIWYALYEAENPSRTEASVKEKDEKIVELTDQLDVLKDKNAQLAYSAGQMDRAADDAISTYKSIMWTGTGFGIAGIALAVTGGVLMTKDKEISVRLSDVSTSDGTLKQEMKSKDVLPYVLLGAGIGMTVVGAVAAGISGYKVMHLDKKESASEGTEVSLEVSPSSIGLNVVF